MMSRGQKPPTKQECARIDRLRILGCICCRLTFGQYHPCEEIHHIVKGGKRLGHWFTLPLCRLHHQGRAKSGFWTSIAQGSKAFAAVHGTEIDLWMKCQHMLELSDELPISKRVPRAA